MNFDHVSDKRLVCGMSGTGKTTLWQKLIKKEKARLRFIYDHEGEFSHRFGVPSVHSPEQLCEKTALGGYVIYDPIEMFPGKAPEGFAFFCDFVFEVCKGMKGRKLLCCDELQKLTDNKVEPEELLKCMECGRRIEVDFFGISHAPHLLHNRIRNQFTEVYTFQLVDPYALQYIEAYGFPAEQVQNLKGHDHMWRNLKTGDQSFPKENAKPEATKPEGKSDSGTAQPGS